MANDAASEKTKKKRRGLWRRASLHGLVLLIFGFMVFRFVVYQRVQNRLNVIRDAGHPVTLEELDAWYEYPEGPNAADVYQQAFTAYMRDLCFEETLPVLGKHIELPRPGEKMPDDVAERAAFYLEQNADAIALLETAGKIGEARYPVDMTKGHRLLLPHLGQLRHGARLIKLKTAMHLHNGEAREAAASAMNIFPLADSLKNEPILISSLVQSSIEAMACRLCTHLIDAGDVDDEMLDRMSVRILAYDARHAYLRGLAGHRCFDNDYFFNTESLYDTSYDLVATIPIKLSRVMGVIALDHAYYLTHMQSVVDVAESGVWPIPESAQRPIDPSLLYNISNIVCASFTAMNLHSYKAEALQRVTIALIGTKRYRQDTGRWPDRLEDISPQYLEHTPIDPFTEQPLKYRREADGVIIYSIGDDGEDNGGLPYDQYGTPGMGSGGTDITTTLNIATETLWPITEKEPEKTSVDLYGDRTRPSDGYGGYGIYDGGHIEIDSEKAFEAYLNMLKTNGFPILSPKFQENRWSSIDQWFANDPEAEQYAPVP